MEEEMEFNKDLYSDVTPIYLEPAPVCSINYSEKFKDVMAYFRGIVKMNEMSERALELTGLIIEMNSADYSAWYYRRRILKSMEGKYDITKEYKFIEDLGDEVSKNYQVWGHRQYIVSVTNNYLKELEFTDKMLEEDNKNYHCWSYRVFICNKFNCWLGELAHTQQMIEKDIRNNSAWSHRFYTLKALNYLDDLEKLRNEIELIEKSLHQSANNESVWVYFTGLYENTQNETFKEECKQFISRIVEERQFCAYARMAYVNIFKNTQKALEFIAELRDRLDMAHQKYWDWYLNKVNPKN